MKKSHKGRAKAKAKAAHEDEQVKPQRRRTMDVLIYVCGAFVIAGGLWLGYLGVFGHLKSHQVLGLWVLYGTFFFVLTGAFLFFDQRLRSQRPTRTAEDMAYDSERAYVVIKSVRFMAGTLQPNKPTPLRFEVWNGGRTPATRVAVFAERTMTNEGMEGVEKAIKRGVRVGKRADNIALANQTLTIDAPVDITVDTPIYAAWESGQAQCYVTATLFYTDVRGQSWALRYWFEFTKRHGFVLARDVSITKTANPEENPY